MQESEFLLSRYESVIVIQKKNDACLIRQTGDNDIFFSTAKEKLELELKKDSSNYEEFRIYMIFDDLMKSIVGRYMLNDYNSGVCLNLPDDFIDLENKCITWHSDGSTDNILTLEYSEEVIKISITKSKVANRSAGNIVRVRTSGSDYQSYYQEFIDFYQELEKLEKSINEEKEDDAEVTLDTHKKSKRKLLSLFRH